MTDRVFGWRRVALVLASARSADLLASVGITYEDGNARSWARTLLDGIDDFFEVYDTDPDGGVAAREIEDQLTHLVGPDVLAALREGAQLLSRPIDGDLDDWSNVIGSLTYQDKAEIPLPRVPLREALRAKVLSIAAEADVGLREFRAGSEQPTEDSWEVAFADQQSVWAFETAAHWAELRRTHIAARLLLAALPLTEREELEAWAQAELYSDPRPSNWPPAPQLNLATAAADEPAQ